MADFFLECEVGGFMPVSSLQFFSLVLVSFVSSHFIFVLILLCILLEVSEMEWNKL